MKEKEKEKNKELKKLNRAELLEILLALSKENEELTKKNKELQNLLESREIKVQEAGSIAEAALQINEVFKVAQEAANQYLENIIRIKEDAQKQANNLPKKKS